MPDRPPSCRLVACRSSDRSWSLIYCNDSDEDITVCVLEVDHPYGDISNIERPSPRLIKLRPQATNPVWGVGSSGAELRTELIIEVRQQRKRWRIRFEFGKLYRRQNLPLIDGIDKPGVVAELYSFEALPMEEAESPAPAEAPAAPHKPEPRPQPKASPARPLEHQVAPPADQEALNKEAGKPNGKENLPTAAELAPEAKSKKATTPPNKAPAKTKQPSPPPQPPMRSARMRALKPCLLVADENNCRRFYQGLGFVVQEIYGPGDEVELIHAERDGVVLQFSPTSAKWGRVRIRHSFSMSRAIDWDLYIQVDDPERLATEFLHRGIVLKNELGTTANGLFGFSIEDPDGYELFFWR